jgi:NDP-sugar pyrophosphorylase family protein
LTKGIILSGGWGTRLRPLTCTIPKTLIPIVNKPVIEHQILHLKAAGVKEIVLAVSVMADSLYNYFKNGEKLGIKIEYTKEKHPMGTAGAVKLAEEYLTNDNFFMLNGDVILNYDFAEMLNAHQINCLNFLKKMNITLLMGRLTLCILTREFISLNLRYSHILRRIRKFQSKEKFFLV